MSITDPNNSSEIADKKGVLKIYKRMFIDYFSCSGHSFNVSNYELEEERDEQLLTLAAALSSGG